MKLGTSFILSDLALAGPEFDGVGDGVAETRLGPAGWGRLPRTAGAAQGPGVAAASGDLLLQAS